MRQREAAVSRTRTLGPDAKEHARRPGAPCKETTKLMEHRWNERKSLALDVHIYHRGVPVARCRTRDLSLDGMQICVGPLGFYKNTPLDVEFTTEYEGRPMKHRLGACVVHCTRNRLGLMLLEVPPEAKRALRRALTGATTASRPPMAAAAAASPRPPVTTV